MHKNGGILSVVFTSASVVIIDIAVVVSFTEPTKLIQDLPICPLASPTPKGIEQIAQITGKTLEHKKEKNIPLKIFIK